MSGTPKQRRAEYERHSDSYKARAKAWREKNAERVKKNRRAYYEANREKIIERARAWEIANPERKRERNRVTRLRDTYGLSAADYAQMLLLQRSRCAICLRSFGPKLKPHTDHDHTSGQLRALLCQQCNHSLGHVEKDDGAWLRRALSYIAHHRNGSFLAVGPWHSEPIEAAE